MGGNLAWTIRLEDGTEFRMDRWTNSLPSLLHDCDFLQGRQEGIDRALAPWLEMKSDWEAHRQSGAFENNMTDVYAPYPYGLKPSEYGLVVTDFQTSTILSLQSYSKLDQVMEMRLAYGARSRDISPGKFDEVETLRQAGRIDHYEVFLAGDVQKRAFLAAGFEAAGTRFGMPVVIIPGTTDYDALCALCDAQRGTDPFERGIERASAILDLSPFSFESFDETPSGYRALHARILELGFDLSSDEEQDWQDGFARLDLQAAERA